MSTLLALAETDACDAARRMLEYPARHHPELLLLALVEGVDSGSDRKMINSQGGRSMGMGMGMGMGDDSNGNGGSYVGGGGIGVGVDVSGVNSENATSAAVSSLLRTARGDERPGAPVTNLRAE